MSFSLTSLNKKYFSHTSCHSFASLTKFHEEWEKKLFISWGEGECSIQGLQKWPSKGGFSFMQWYSVFYPVKRFSDPMLTTPKNMFLKWQTKILKWYRRPSNWSQFLKIASSKFMRRRTSLNPYRLILRLKRGKDNLDATSNELVRWLVKHCTESVKNYEDLVRLG